MAIELAALLSLLLVIGFVSQWLAWRLHVPGILILLLAGILIGPVTHWFNPDHALGELLFPSASLAVALILFEGSLTLRLGDLRQVGKAVRGLVTYGAAVAVVLLAAAGHWIAGLSWPIAFLFGALTCVTGPTVITPMLRTLRCNARTADTLRWEGIVLDPLGALAAVLLFHAILLHEQGHSVQMFAITLAMGIGVGAIAAWAVGFLLSRHLIPDYLQTYGTLAAALGVFSLGNSLADESGLLAVTVMGIVLGNIKDLHIEHIIHFKEHLSTVLVSLLFVILAARLPWPFPHGSLWTGILVFLVAQFLIRPISVAIATFRSELSLRERALIAYICPRGIVAAAVSSLFALRLHALGVPGSQRLVPLVFILIIGTVVLQSLTARPLTRWLKVADPARNGALIFGTNPVALTIARTLAEQKVSVLVVDDDWDGIESAHAEGLRTFYGSPTSEHAELYMDLTGIGQLLAMSTRREMNSLACMQYRRVFGPRNVYHLHVLAPSMGSRRTAFARSIRAKAMFNDELTNARLRGLLAAGWRIHAAQITEGGEPDKATTPGSTEAIPLFAIDPSGALHTASNEDRLDPKPGWLLLALAPPGARVTGLPQAATTDSGPPPLTQPAASSA